MRTLFYAALLAGLTGSTLTIGSPASAADLDYYYQPRPVPVLPPPRCGIDRPCLHPYPRYGYGVPGYSRYRPYDYPQDRFYHYGYGHPRPDPYSPEGEIGRYGYDGPRDGYTDRYNDEERRRAQERFEVAPPDYGIWANPYDRG